MGSQRQFVALASRKESSTAQYFREVATSILGFCEPKTEFYRTMFWRFLPAQMLDFRLWKAKIRASNFLLFNPKNMKKISDEKLYELCRQYGKQVLEWRNKFAGLLPEVDRRGLYQKKGFGSIFEFAFKLAGLSEAQVKLALSLDQKFADKPALRELLTRGRVSAGKLVRVAAGATVENQNFLADQVRLLPKSALETLARDMKCEMAEALPGQKNEIQNGLFESKIEELKLSGEVVEKLTELQERGIDVNELILEFLEKREKKIKEKKLEVAKKITGTVATRYIPTEVKKLIKEEHGTKCAVPNCKKAAEALHHTARFGLVKGHNPYFMAPLCHEHHMIAHSIDQKFQANRLMT